MVGKGVIGVWAGSRALLADAVHSAADLAGSVAVMVGLRVAQKPPDADHPYGHGKAELVSSAVVAVLLIVAALRVGETGITALWQPPKEPEWAAPPAAPRATCGHHPPPPPPAPPPPP
ncbi:MAG: cation diffusion facilitator family transporter, partial [Alicyclobacillus sp.]|nr:cation diffusion facilitator family transporter [Alicyclobacillus sp.]